MSGPLRKSFPNLSCFTQRMTLTLLFVCTIWVTSLDGDNHPYSHVIWALCYVTVPPLSKFFNLGLEFLHIKFVLTKVLVKIGAAGVNPLDTLIRTGMSTVFQPTLPYTPGIDGAGVVHSVGEGVKHVKVSYWLFNTLLEANV